MNRPQVYVIGAGPAGCAAAIALADCGAGALDVTLVCGDDRREERIGETLPPAAAAILRQQGLGGLLTDPPHLQCPGSLSQWGSETAGYNDFFLTPIGAGYHLDRARFDADLLSAAADRRVRVLEKTRLVAIESLGSQLSLVLLADRNRHTQRADYVVDASGIQARAARGLGVARNEYDCVLSVGAFFPLRLAPRQPAHTLVCAAADGWWYATQLPGDRALVSLCTDAQIVRSQGLDQPDCWHRKLHDASWLLQRMEAQLGAPLERPPQLWQRAAPSAILSRVHGPRWVAVGDAAASYDSLTSAGISKALAQGLEAGSAVGQRLSGGGDQLLDDYQDRVFAEFSAYLRLHQQLYRSEPRFSQQPFWQRRLRGGRVSSAAA
ncbi:MAG: tryptophan 7-halogenase [Xanthomonadales bacterium]|nr:tryptophan 7-halogenase [Xanthomonadales bacterium]